MSNDLTIPPYNCRIQVKMSPRVVDRDASEGSRGQYLVSCILICAREFLSSLCEQHLTILKITSALREAAYRVPLQAVIQHTFSGASFGRPSGSFLASVGLS